MVRTLNTIVDYLCGYIGESNIPLSYMAYYDPTVKPEAYDPSANLKTSEEEIIDRTPHTQGGIPQYLFASDNRKVDDILTSMVKDTNAWTWTKGSTRVHNGWRMVNDLKTHYLGDSSTDNIVDKAELMLHSKIYTEKKV